MRLQAPSDEGGTNDLSTKVAIHDGSFELLVRPGNYVLGAIVEQDPKHRTQSMRGESPATRIVSPSWHAVAPREDIELVLDTGTPPAITVRTENGEAAADVVVRAWSIDVPELPALEAPAHEFEHGWSALHPGTWKLAAFASDYAPSTMETCWLDGTPRQLDFVLRRYACVAGKLVDASGAAIVGARIVARQARDWPDGFGVTPSESVSGADGAFELARVLPEPAQLVVEVKSKWWNCGEELRLASGATRKDLVFVWNPAGRASSDGAWTWPARRP